jgi:phospholipase/lecithinase/hemolysin
MRVKSRIYIILSIAIICFCVLPARAAFTSLYVFGDSLSCTTNNPYAGPNYYGQRYCNGRVWVEFLANRQGLVFDSNANNSFYGNYSTNVLKTLKAFPSPPDSNTCLVVVWVNNADIFNLALSTYSLDVWTNTINQSQTSHYQIITNLYAKGIRTLVMPNVVDISTIPKCNHWSGGYTTTIHQQCIAYNAAFTNTLARAMVDCPGLTIYSPDFFTLLNNLLANPSSYGVINPLYNYGTANASIDALSASGGNFLANDSTGANYIFWDPYDPTSKVHNWMASIAQQLISPVQIAQMVPLAGSNRLDIINLPLLTNGVGVVLVSADMSSGIWSSNLTFNLTNTVQSVFVPTTGSQCFYRLNFPVVWTWPGF